MIFEIPLDSTDEQYRQTVVSLDGSDYLFEIVWSPSSQSWYLSMYRQTDTVPAPVVEGLRLSAMYPLLAGVTEDVRPPGELMLIVSELSEDPLRLELGSKAKLYYFDRDSLG